MNDSKQVLNGMINTLQMGQLGIREILDTAVRVELRKELHSQLAEYDRMETQVRELARERGWQLKELRPALKKLSVLACRLQLLAGRTDSRIAAMMIQGNTRGMILGYKDLHRSPAVDPQVKTMSKHLLERERINIVRMQRFL